MASVVVYSKPNCEICKTAKEKLAVLRVEYEEQDLESAVVAHDGWQDDGTIDVMVAWVSLNQAVPLIKIDNEFHTYPSAMKALKALG